MKKVVANVFVLVWASLYLLTKNMVETACLVRREFSDTFLPIIGEIPLLQCILILCLGVFSLGITGILMAAMSAIK